MRKIRDDITTSILGIIVCVLLTITLYGLFRTINGFQQGFFGATAMLLLVLITVLIDLISARKALSKIIKHNVDQHEDKSK